MALSIDDNVAGTVYLEPQEFSGDFGRMERLHSANDSGIVEFHGSHSGSRIGLSIPNDCYRVFDSDQEYPPVTPPRAFYPAAQGSNGHGPGSTQFPFPLSAPTSNPLPSKRVVPPSSRAKDDPNIYTAIDEASLLTFHGDMFAKPGDSAPLVCSYRPTGSRQISAESAQSKGRENVLYEPPRADRRRAGSGRAQGTGKAGPFSGKCCLSAFFNLIAVAAFALALFQTLRSSLDTRHEQLATDYQSLKVANEDLKKMQLNIENNFSGMLTERLRELNDSLISGVASRGGDSASLMLFRLLINDSDLRRRLFDSFEGRMDLLKAELESKVDSAKKQLEQLDSQKVQQLRMYVGGLLPVNMSACEYNSQSKGTAASEPEHSTGSKDLTGKFVLRAFCTTDGGIDAHLEYSSNSPNTYSCTCRGQRNGVASRFCVLHYWTCPYL